MDDEKNAYKLIFNQDFTPTVASHITKDVVNHPTHYTEHPSGVECIQITQHMNFCRGNAVKYIWRAGAKDSAKEIEDLRKAVFYLNKEIERIRDE